MKYIFLLFLLTSCNDVVLDLKKTLLLDIVIKHIDNNMLKYNLSQLKTSQTIQKRFSKDCLQLSSEYHSKIDEIQRGYSFKVKKLQEFDKLCEFACNQSKNDLTK
jgi:hypothetical protein